MNIYSIPFALTLVSELTPAEIELLQKHDTRALSLCDLVNNEEVERFRIGFCPRTEYGSVSTNGVIFVGEFEDGKAALSILIPANLKGDAVGNYIDEKLATIARDVAVVEANAKKALVNVRAAKETFLKSIIPLAPKTAKEATAPAATKEVVKAVKTDGGKK